MGLFEAFLVRRGVIEPLAAVEVLETVCQQRPRLGQLALRERLLSVGEVCDVLERQVESRLPFGAIAVDLGYLTAGELGGLLQLQQRTGPRGAELLCSRGLLDDGSLRKLEAQYTSDLGSQYAGEPQDADVTDLLAAQGLSLLLARARGVTPFAPAVASALAHANAASFDPESVAREIAKDRRLWPRLEYLARAPWFAGMTCRLGCGHEGGAVALFAELGKERTRELLYALTFADVFDRGTERESLTAHAVAIAAIAHTLAGWSKLVEPTLLGVAGLWHDVGRLLFCRSAELDRAALGSDEEEFPTSSHLIERMRFGFDHAVLGELALRLWGFPGEVASLVGLHHYHRPPVGLAAKSRIALGLLEAADLFEHGFAARDSSQFGRLEGLWSRFALAEALPLTRVRAEWRQLRDARTAALDAFEEYRVIAAPRPVASAG
ncbi:MAG TPA: HDOD domain-containing protein [Polyangiaceae bacterium]